MSAITDATCRSRWMIVAHARMSAYRVLRWMRGSTPRRFCWIAAQRSLSTSRATSAAVRSVL